MRSWPRRRPRGARSGTVSLTPLYSLAFPLPLSQQDDIDRIKVSSISATGTGSTSVRLRRLVFFALFVLFLQMGLQPTTAQPTAQPTAGPTKQCQDWKKTNDCWLPGTNPIAAPGGGLADPDAFVQAGGVGAFFFYVYLCIVLVIHVICCVPSLCLLPFCLGCGAAFGRKWKDYCLDVSVEEEEEQPRASIAVELSSLQRRETANPLNGLDSIGSSSPTIGSTNDADVTMRDKWLPVVSFARWVVIKLCWFFLSDFGFLAFSLVIVVLTCWESFLFVDIGSQQTAFGANAFQAPIPMSIILALDLIKTLPALAPDCLCCGGWMLVYEAIISGALLEQLLISLFAGDSLALAPPPTSPLSRALGKQSQMVCNWFG